MWEAVASRVDRREPGRRLQPCSLVSAFAAAVVAIQLASGFAAAHENRILCENRRVVDEVIKRGVRKAMLMCKKDGLPVVVERDGKIEW